MYTDSEDREPKPSRPVYPMIRRTPSSDVPDLYCTVCGNTGQTLPIRAERYVIHFAAVCSQVAHLAPIPRVPDPHSAISRNAGTGARIFCLTFPVGCDLLSRIARIRWRAPEAGRTRSLPPFSAPSTLSYALRTAPQPSVPTHGLTLIAWAAMQTSRPCDRACVFCASGRPATGALSQGRSDSMC